MRHLAVLTVALLLVLAGCNGAPGGATTVEPTTDATPTGTEATSSGSDANPDEAERPPGLSADGVTDAEALAAAHAEALANRSYTYHRDVTLTATDGSELGRWSQRVQVGSDRLAFNFTQTGAGVVVTGTPVGDARTYTNGSVTFANASELSDGYRRSAGRGFAASRFDGERLLADALSGSETDVTTVERDGETRHVVRVESEQQIVASDRATVGEAEREIEATNLTATAFVSPSGFVENVTYEYDFERGDVTGHRTETVRYAAVGETTVERPAWYDEAVNETGGD